MKIRAESLTKKCPHPGSNLMNLGNQTFNPITILEDVNLNIDSGEILAVLGISGSGKSTLLGLLAGLDLPTDGKVFWNEKDITVLSEDERALLRLQKAGFIFQNFELLPSYTALENVLLPLELNNTQEKQDKEKKVKGKKEKDKKEKELKETQEERAKRYLQWVGLEERLFHYPNQLSGGEQQRVAIARAFAIEPDVLFLDEPTGNLDQKTGADIINLILELNQKKRTTMICVTHDPALSNICSRQLRLVGGKLFDE